jgi:histidine ammonia-lyase
MEREIAHLGHARSTIRTAITEEPYFTGETTHRMGAGNHQRRVLAFDLEAAPTVVKEIASVSEDFVANLK